MPYVTMELINDFAIHLLKNNMEDALGQVDEKSNELHEEMTGQELDLQTPDIPQDQYFTYNLEAVQYPACILIARTEEVQNSEFGYDEQVLLLEIEFYTADADRDRLRRLVNRYVEAGKTILRNQDNWENWAFNPEIAGTFYSNVIQNESGFLRAGRINVQLGKIQDFEEV